MEKVYSWIELVIFFVGDKKKFDAYYTIKQREF